jgi:hypothetical protein
MSDMRTEMNKVMDKWNPKPTPVIKKTFGELVFNYVKNHPLAHAKEICEALDPGKTQSVASTLKNLFDRGMLDRVEKPVPNYPGVGHRTRWEYTAKVAHYQTINKDYWRPKHAKPKKEVRIKEAMYRAPVPRITAPLEIAAPLERRLEMPTIFNAKDFIEKLSVTQAKEIYIQLKSIFESRLHG